MVTTHSSISSSTPSSTGTSSRTGSAASTDSPWPFLTLTESELQYLVQHRVVEPAAGSPVGLLLDGLQPAEATEPGQDSPNEAVGVRLQEKGLIRHLPPKVNGTPEAAASEAGELFRRALEVLAQPEARLIIVRQSPGEEPSLIPLFVSGELAAPGFIDDEGLHLGVPMDRQQLLDSIRINLQSDNTGELESPVTLSPLVLQAVETLWRGTGRELSAAISRHQARLLLLEMIGDQQLVQGLLRLLLQVGVIQEHNGGYALTPSYLPWFERVLSGHSCAVEFTALGDDGSVQSPEPDRLLFFGPPGQRVLCSHPEAGATAAPTLDRPSPPVSPPLAEDHPSAESQPNGAPDSTSADPLLYFSAPSERLLSWKLRRLIGSES
ncbi:MAG: hypothetical protein SX243_22505 [Acidobacteriota bacterium]|nr:hypothetical protein [Acidobacteriota bacterium]